MTTHGPNHRARPCAAALALAFAFTATGTLAEIVDIRWDTSGRFERSLGVAPGKFAEVCGTLPAGLKVGWAFEASAPLDFNLHYHVGKQVVYPAKLGAVATAKDSLSTKIDQDYCWMWSNKSSAPATLRVTLQR
jgi:hypothetical protein